MKKSILFLALILTGLFAHSQTYIMNGVLTSGTYSTSVSGRMASFQISTTSAFNGTTTTDTLKYSNDNGMTWSTCMQNDGTTAMAFTLASGVNNKTWNLITTPGGWYAVFHAKGNATLGKVYVVMIQK